MDLLRRTPTITRSRLLLAIAFVVAALLALSIAIDPPKSTHASGSMSADPSAVPAGSTSSSTVGAAVAPAGRTTGAAPAGGGSASGELDATTAKSIAATPMVAPATANDVEPLPGDTSAGAPTLDAKVLRTADVSIRVRHGRFDEQWARAMRLAGSYGGYVASSSLSKYGAKAPRSGSITLRVPAAHFDDALSRLRALGVVVSLDQSSQDVTQEYVDAKSRLRHDRAVEAQLLQLLGNTRKVSDALAVQDRLDTLQQQIEVETGRLQYLDKMTAFSTLDLHLSEPGAGSPHPKPTAPESWGLGTAIDDAAHRAVANVNRSIVWLGGALPPIVPHGTPPNPGRMNIHRPRECTAL
jgi:hypothetical protein